MMGEWEYLKPEYIRHCRLDIYTNENNDALMYIYPLYMPDACVYSIW